MSIGYFNQADAQALDNINLTDLRQYAFTDGVTADFVMQDLMVGIQGYSENRAGSVATAILKDLLTTPGTSQMDIRYLLGDIDWHESTEYGSEAPQRLSTADAMCYPQEFEAAIGYTGKALRSTNSQVAIGTNRRLLDGAANMDRKNLLRTLFTSVTARTLKNGGKAPGWVGGGDQDYKSPKSEGVSFDSDTHLLATATDTAAGRLALFGLMRDRLWEHGYFSEEGAPLILVHGPLTLGDVKGVSSYTSRKLPFMDYAPGSTTTYAAFGTDLPASAFHGVLSDSGAWCLQIGGIPDNYFGMFKSLGSRQAFNPIQLWEPADIGSGIRLMDAEGQFITGRMSKLNKITLYRQSGYGVRMPDMGVVGFVDAGNTYVDPTIT